MRTGSAHLPLHGGRAPAWLFSRMVRLSREITARFSFAVGGKDGFPYPVDLETYDRTVDVLRAAVNKANIDRSERVKALKRLVEYGKSKVAARQAARATTPEDSTE